MNVGQPILTSEEMARADQATFRLQQIESRVIMENAGRAVAMVAADLFEDSIGEGVIVICGAGNNGGDGYVAARALRNLGVSVQCLALGAVDEMPPDAKANAQSWQAVGGATTLLDRSKPLKALEQLLATEPGLLIDAIFGTGFHGEPRAPFAALFERLNVARAASGISVLSVDVPSGVNASTGEVGSVAIEADATVVLQSLKLGHVLFPGARHCGTVIKADIGIDIAVADVAASPRWLLDEASIQPLLRRYLSRDVAAHKGTKGHVFVVGGSAGHYGAVRMAAEAALRTGAGLVTMVLPKRAADIISPELRELMCLALPSDEMGNFAAAAGKELAAELRSADAVLCGPGLGTGQGAKDLVRTLVDDKELADVPFVLDADALNILAECPDLLCKLGERAVLTPHPGEMGRLCGKDSVFVQQQRLDVALKFVASAQCQLVLKGARSIIASAAGQIAINPTATDALATAGSGDVLSGMIAAFLGRGMPAFEAAQAAVFVHGLVGEAIESGSQASVGITATDIIAAICGVIEEISRSEPNCTREFLQYVLPAVESAGGGERGAR